MYRKHSSIIHSLIRKDSSLKATLKVIADPIAVTGISVPSLLEIIPDKPVNAGAKVLPSNADNKKIEYSVDNEKIATVDENGMITGHTMGKTTVFAYTDDGFYYDTYPVRVLFRDVTDKSKAAYNAIYWGADHGIVAGYGKYFDINNSVTRAQVVLFLWRAAGKPKAKATKLSFKDAAEIEKMAPDYKKAILWGSENGIVMGFTSGAKAGYFKPNDPCTRGQIVTFLWRYDGRHAAKNGAKPFPDVKKTHIYYNSIMWASSYGITTGFPDGQFKPDRNCTRGQCVTFLYRMLK